MPSAVVLRVLLGLPVLLTGALAGCGTDPGEDGGGDWAVAESPLGEDVVMGDAEVDGAAITLADGTTLDVGSPVSAFVVAGDGVYAVPQTEEEGDGDLGAELLLVTAEGTQRTGAHPLPRSLRTSPDGRFLGFVDLGAEPYAEPAAAVVVDLAEGSEVVRSSDGMGAADDPDLEALYAELEPGVFAVTTERAYVKTTGPVYSYALPSGEQTTEAEQVEDVYDAPWFTALEDEPLTQFPRDPEDPDQ